MTQLARNETTTGWGFLDGMRKFIHDRDTKFCSEFRSVLRGADVTPLRLPALNTNLTAYAERWVRTVEHKCTLRRIFFDADWEDLIVAGGTSLLSPDTSLRIARLST